MAKLLKKMLKMPKIMPSTKDLLGKDLDMGLPRMKPKKRRRTNISRLLRDV